MSRARVQPVCEPLGPERHGVEICKLRIPRLRGREYG